MQSAITGFNSTMVRLKGEYIDVNPNITQQFQFHNGSIKRRYL